MNLSEMAKKSSLTHLVVCWLIISCSPAKKEETSDTNPRLFAKDNLVAWCVVPFDAKERNPEQRAIMLNELGLTQLAYDWRAKHLTSFPDELNSLKDHGIKLTSVWMWVDSDTGKIIDDTNEQLLEIIRQHNIKTEIWLGISQRHFDGLTDDEKLRKAVSSIGHIEKRAKEMGCSVSLYNHGDWFGDPRNQVKIIETMGAKDIGIIYNFHHAHEQIDEFPALLESMLPYLKTVNLNGMKAGGPKILPIGDGNRELDMLQILKKSGYNGPIGILGHVEDEDVMIVLKRNLDGLKTLLEKMNDSVASSTY